MGRLGGAADPAGATFRLAGAVWWFMGTVAGLLGGAAERSFLGGGGVLVLGAGELWCLGGGGLL